MLKKTLMHRILNHLKPDPKKINTSYAAVEEAEREDVIEMDVEDKPLRPVPPPPVVVVEETVDAPPPDNNPPF